MLWSILDTIFLEAVRNYSLQISKAILVLQNLLNKKIFAVKTVGHLLFLHWENSDDFIWHKNVLKNRAANKLLDQ